MKLEFFVIGFKSDFRGTELVSQLRGYGFPVSVIEAEDFRTFALSDLSYDVSLSQLWNGRSLAPSELGCLSSHRKTWEVARLNGLDWAFVFEDDAKINKNEFDVFMKTFCSYQNWASKPQFITFYWPYAIQNVFAQYFERKYLHALGLFKAIHPTYGTVGYAVNASALEKLKKRPQLEATTADWPIEVFATNFYVTQKNLLTHPDGSSSIQDEREVVQSRLKKEVPNFETGFAIAQRFKNILVNTRTLKKSLRQSEYSNPSLLVGKRFLYQMYYFGYLKFPFLRIRNGCEESKRQKNIAQIMIIALRYLTDEGTSAVRRVVKSLMSLLLNNFHAMRRILFRIAPNAAKSIFKELTSNVSYILELERKYKSVRFRRYLRNRNTINVQIAEWPFASLEREPESISCIITVFNQSALEIDNALTSLLKQTSSLSEIIIVDDGSTNPETIAYLNRGFPTERIKIIRQINSGVCRARNIGAEACSSKWIVFFDPDDLMNPEFCKEALNLISVAPTLDIVCGKVRINADGKISYWDPGPFGANYMLVANRIPMSSLIRRDFFFQIGGFNPEFENLGSEDWDLWSRAVFYGARVGKIKGFSYEYTVDSLKTSRSKLTDRNKVLQRNAIRETYIWVIKNLHSYYSPKN
jgi:GR25 family glycosyltransferase involved in LPS biosynthesis/GT2 family glycosyltransferase